jgi:MFS family permease
VKNGKYHLLFHLLVAFTFSLVIDVCTSKDSISYDNFLAPIASVLCNKFGCGLVGVFGSTLASVAVAASVFSPNIYIMWLLFGVCGGIGMCLAYLPTIIMIGHCFEKKRAIVTGKIDRIHCMCLFTFGYFVVRQALSQLVRALARLFLGHFQTFYSTYSAGRQAFCHWLPV